MPRPSKILRKQDGGGRTFNMIDFSSLTPDIINKKCEDRVRKLTKRKEELLALDPSSLTFHTFIWPQIDIFADFPEANYFATSQVHPNQEVRASCTKATNVLELLLQDIDKELFHHFQYYYTNKYKAEEASLDHEYRRFITFKYNGFKDLGLFFDTEIQTQLRDLGIAISNLETKFDAAKKAYNPDIVFTEEELKGMKPEFIASRKKADGTIHLTKMDLNLLVRKDCDIPSTRQKAVELYFHQNYPENLDFVEQTLSLRKQKAKLLGYESHLALVVKNDMNNNPERLINYIDNLLDKLKPIEMAQRDKYEALAKKDGLVRMEDYDQEYYTEKYLKLQNVDQSQMVLYLPIWPTLEEVLQIYSELMTYDFIQTHAYDGTLWDDNVLAYEVYEQDTKLLTGLVFFDLIERPGKNNASMINYYQTYTDKTLPVMCVSMNVVGTNKCLKTVDNLRTIIHELGHGMHKLAMKSRISRYTGFSNEFDFGEIPSIMFDRMGYEPVIFRRILKKTFPKVTNRPLSEEDNVTIEQMCVDLLKLKELSNLKWYYQAGLAKLDLLAHGKDYPETFTKGERPTDKFIIQVSTDFYGHDRAGRTADGTIINRFSEWIHPMFPTYAGKYHSYVTCHGYALDLFTKFQPMLENLHGAGDYAKSVLFRYGGGLASSRAIELFLQRKPAPETAFVASFGPMPKMRHDSRKHRRQKGSSRKRRARI
jgi:Zn-dependent oligopeptidase